LGKELFSKLLADWYKIGQKGKTSKNWAFEKEEIEDEEKKTNETNCVV
jgi:hypothetical protein